MNKGLNRFEVIPLDVDRQRGEASPVECYVCGPLSRVCPEIVVDGFRDRGWVSRRVLSGDVLLVAEDALMRATCVGDEERDDHDNSADSRRKAVGSIYHREE